MTYSEKLKDPRWQKKRMEVLSHKGQKCSCCLRDDLEIHVHHINYLPGREPWEYEMNELAVVCYNCHKKAELAIRNFRESLFNVGKDTVTALNAAWSILMAKPPFKYDHAIALESVIAHIVKRAGKGGDVE